MYELKKFMDNDLYIFDTDRHYIICLFKECFPELRNFS